MLKENRQREIIKLLMSKGSVEVNQVCRIFSVAEMTIRRDLDELAARGVIIRTHGGALLSEKNILSEQPFDVRNSQNLQEKKAIARLALNLISNGQKIILDSGTTTFCLARMIDNTRRLVVVTNAINIASELNMRTDISVISVGGDLRRNTLSCVGHFAEEMVKQFRCDIAFLGVGGVSERGDLSNAGSVEVGIKRAMIEAAKRTVVLADSSKIGHEMFARIENLRAVDLLITDSKASEDMLNSWKKLGVEIQVAEVE
jgi:DeoR/GlpR family transcriptional regulator of sugar metabolism